MMKKLIISARDFIKYSFRLLKRIINRSIPRKQCYICKKKLFRFNRFRGGSKLMPEFFRQLEIVGSDIDNFSCPFCSAHDRERHLFMFFDKLNLWEMCLKTTLHFAPEINLYKKISSLRPLKYIVADIAPDRFSFCSEIEKIDITNIPYDDNKFNLVIANHVLEHIPDYMKAFKELYRVLKTGGIAILQTPYSNILKNNFEDFNICNDALREKFYGQSDHCRVYGQQLFEELNEIGFNSTIHKHSDYFSDDDAYYFGVNKDEPLVIFLKPV